VEFARIIFAIKNHLSAKAAAGLPSGEMQLSLFFGCFFSHAGFYTCNPAWQPRRLNRHPGGLRLS